MKFISTIAAGVAGLLALQGSAAAHAQPQLPPPAIYDPQAGPFIVQLNDQGRVGDEQRGVIANALKLWSGPALQAFVICFRSQHEPVDWTVAHGALEAVSGQLKAQGAAVVVMPSGGLCDPWLPRPAWKGAHVEIMGLVRT
ncbi:hypothetical protein EWE75_21055 [Sphingomonas populi]|uniref:Uncharacterized protein n=1 Tax=Sphingomonas populi TaxID=2484750 RepID=A0A4Q6XL24_9SPHN|nr:hypothetical protein [Sphingomonas populi]RZF60800.1 hypothetical protein EWE75_21055 [Sphingomonas populi]